MLAVVWVPVFAFETVTLGEGGELDWRGEGSSAVETIDAEYLAPLDPNNPGAPPELLTGNAPGDLVEFDSADFPRGIFPLRIKDGENVANNTMARGGNIDAPNIFDFGRDVSVASGSIFDRNDLLLALQELLTSEDGGEKQAFERKNFNALGTLVILNLGGRFGVNRIRFYPRNTVHKSPTTPFHNDFLRAFELFTNDGISQTNDGSLIWDPLLLHTDNENPVVDVTIDPPSYVQFVRLRATSTVNFEIDEFEVYGTGFLSEAQYLSDIFDAGQPALWGDMRWVEEVVGPEVFSRLQIRTRTASDATPFVFTRLLSGKRDAEEIPFSLEDPTREMELAEYETLPKDDALGRQWSPGLIRDDLINWSPFSTPYPASAANGLGIPIASPSPNRYFQFRVSFQSDDLEAARGLKSLSFDLLTPPFADEVIGEIFPREVRIAENTTFTYAVRPVLEKANLRGFDTIEIFTPTRVESIDRLELVDETGQLVAERVFAGLEDTTSVDGLQILAVDDDKFSVRIPFLQAGSALIKIYFQTEVLTYSTNFTAAVRLSDEEGSISQAVVSGDAATLASDDDADLSGTTVLSPSVLRGDRLLDRMEIVPAVFTPNGDRVNDVARVYYNLLALDVARPVEIAVYDLSGRLIRIIHDAPERNGRYEDKTWDGLNAQGQLVPPGLYIVRLAIEGDAQQDGQSRLVGVAY
ncbi:MAG: hypothetical protein OXM01_08180 [Gemmatimonadota bacterium]|nr:hypothetical protein [Gemmatimonadota bacterium]